MPHPTSPTPLDILRDTFGFPAFIGEQQGVVEHVTAGHDALVFMPTGGGKSVCYQIPAILRPGVGVVVSPLIALMQDQVRSLVANGVRAAYLNSSLTADQAFEVERQARNGELDLLYVAPERAVRPDFLALVERAGPALFAIDEAHCVSQWGHDFRPEYMQLDVFAERFPGVPRMALTATADGPTRKDIRERLRFTDTAEFSTGYDRPNIRYTVIPKDHGQRQLLAFIKNEHARDSGIVYRMSRKKVEQTAAFLVKHGINALPYHAGMNADARARNQERFMLEDGLVMVATIAFGMGVDKPDVRFVAHLEPPKSVEAYHQETGRAGRDGLAADAWLAFGLGDVGALRALLLSGDAPEERKRVEMGKLNALLGYLEHSGCRRQALLGYFGQDMPTPCGNCDTCVTPPTTFDGTVAAQKALSCIFRTGGRFGANHLTDVLLGNATTRAVNLGHTEVSTWGIGAEHTKDEWKSIYRQLAARCLVDVDMEGYGALKLNEASWRVLKGQEQVSLRIDPRAAKAEKKRKARALPKLSDVDAIRTPEDEALFNALRDLRMEIAKQAGIPPYAVFADRTLLEMVAYRPRTVEDVGQMFGVGAAKLARYGQPFADAIADHARDHGVPDDLPPMPQRREVGPNPSAYQPDISRPKLTATVRASIELMKDLRSLPAVAEERGLKESTIYQHAATGIRLGELDLHHCTDLTDNEISTIREAIATYGQAHLTPAYDALGSRYPYPILRCVQAMMQRETEDE